MSAEGLTEALHRAFHDHWSPGEALNLYADSPLWQVQAAAVERILADRLAAVQAEQAVEWERARLHAKSVQDRAHARAASAEAERDAALAALDRVKALADLWMREQADYPPEGAMAAAAVRLCAGELRAAVEGGAS